ISAQGFIIPFCDFGLRLIQFAPQFGRRLGVVLADLPNLYRLSPRLLQLVEEGATFPSRRAEALVQVSSEARYFIGVNGHFGSAPLLYAALKIASLFLSPV